MKEGYIGCLLNRGVSWNTRRFSEVEAIENDKKFWG